MKHYHGFERSSYSFAERYGDPDDFSCAIGRVAIAFSSLEDEVEAAIRRILKQGENVIRVLTAEMSFKNRVNAFASLARQLYGRLAFNVGSANPEEMISELAACCFRAEELRNQIMHSSWEGPRADSRQAIRRKFSAKATHGLRRHTESMDADYLLDIADYIVNVSCDVQEFVLTLPEPDSEGVV